MVRVSKTTIKNFKFYINESIDINSKNFLIYGENGVGKSSLFMSLYYIFYGHFDNSLINHIEQFKNRDSDEDIELLVQFSNDDYIRIDENSINSDVSILEKQNIYLLDYKFLDTFFDKNDFFLTLEAIQNRFIVFDDIFEGISDINQALEVTSIESMKPKRVELNSKLKELLSGIEDSTNKIIVELKEKFTIKLDLEEAQLEEGALRAKLHKPKIYIEIDGIRDFKSHFNESKIKILSLSLVFAIIKLNKEKYPSTNSDSLKLLVLDDFLSSLDMGNRLYIMEYIFNNFEDYQKIILTHNSLFFNIIKRLIYVHNQTHNWEHKNLYQSLQMNGIYEPKFFKKDNNYLIKAEELFKQEEPDYEGCGNSLRKEIERIIFQAQFLFQTGKKEKLENAIMNIRKEKQHYINPSEFFLNIETLLNDFSNNHLMNEAITLDKKSELLKNKINSLFQNQTINSEKLNKILRNISFYQTILNEASHYDNQAEYFKKEYKEALEDVKKLQEVFNDFNKLQTDTR